MRVSRVFRGRFKRKTGGLQPEAGTDLLAGLVCGASSERRSFPTSTALSDQAVTYAVVCDVRPAAGGVPQRRAGSTVGPSEWGACTRKQLAAAGLFHSLY